MHLNIEGHLKATQRTQVWKADRFDIFWEGFVFIKGQAPGQPSVQAFAKDLEVMSIHDASGMLSGNYVLVIRDNLTRDIFAFTDGGRLSHLFYTPDTVCSSFLELASASRLHKRAMNLVCIVEFVLTGLLFTDEIFFDHIKILGANEIIVISPNRRISIDYKRDADPFQKPITSHPQEAFLGIIEAIAHSIQSLNVSVDLTGGTDSRLLAGLLDYFGVHFETAVSGISVHSDIKIATEVSSILGPGHPLHVTHHSFEPSALWNEIDFIVEATDGLCDAVQPHRLYQLQSERLNRGVNLALGSAGGELYKDGGWWRQALLTCPGKQANQRLLRRLVDTGLVQWGMGKVPFHIFSHDLSQIVLDYKDHIYNRLLRYLTNENQDRYNLADRIFYQYSVRAPRGFACRLIDTYIPFLDPECVSIGIRIPKLYRFAHRFYRQILSDINPRLAQLPTNRGAMSMHNGMIATLADLFRMAHYQIASPKATGKDNPELYPTLRILPETGNVISSFKDLGLLRKSLELDQLQDSHLGRLVTLYKIIEKVG